MANHIADIKRQIRTYKDMTATQGAKDLDFWQWRFENRESNFICIGCYKVLCNDNCICEDCEEIYKETVYNELHRIDIILGIS